MPLSATRHRGPATPSSEAVAGRRLEALVEAHLPVLWRFTRRLGVAEHEVDDVLQEVIMVTARKLELIAAGAERSFMMSTAYRVAADHRRAQRRKAEVELDEALGLSDPGPGPEALTEQLEARRLLDTVLEQLPLEQRAVFVLYELEGATMAEIAAALELAPGTVASRLRRARELFEAQIARLERASSKRGGPA